MRNLRLWLSADRVAALIFIGLFAAYGLMGSKIRSALAVDVVGPGFFPTAIGVMGVLLAVVLLFNSKPDDETVFEVDAVALTPALLLIAYVVSLPFLGFAIATPIFLTVAFKFLGCPSWTRAIFFALLGTFAAVGLFSVLLEVRLPTGYLSTWWRLHG